MDPQVDNSEFDALIKMSAHETADGQLNDNILQNVRQLLSSLPGGLGTLVAALDGAHSTVDTLRRAARVKKLGLFAQQVDQLTTEERREATEKHFGTPEEQRESAETIVLLLDNVDDMQKAVILGRIWCQCARGQIVRADAMRLSRCIGRCIASDLELIVRFEPGVQSLDTDIAEALWAAGFLTQGGHDGGNCDAPETSGVLFEINQFGRILRDEVLLPLRESREWKPELPRWWNSDQSAARSRRTAIELRAKLNAIKS